VELFGIDIGFGFTKVTNGSDQLAFKSIYGEATDIQFKENILDTNRDENLHIELDDNGYFIGELAERQSTVRHFTLDQNQLMGNFAKILTLGALGRLAKDDTPIKLVTGLPIKFYSAHREQLIQKLTGRHSITVVSPNGSRSEKVINIAQVKVIPQPFGSMYNLMLDDAGEAGDRRFLTEKVGVIDIGFRTADYTVSNRTKYLERASRTFDTGISQSFTILANKLQESSGVNVELFRLFEAAKKGNIKIRGKNYDLAKSLERIHTQLASEIANEVNQLWLDEWDIDNIVISGGGGAVLAPYLNDLIEGNILPMDPNEDARFNNVKGYLKYAKYLWGRTPAQGPKAGAASQRPAAPASEASA
jgi:plasmid segregation protein ParM